MRLLEAAGIAVTTGVLAEEAARAHSGHIQRITKGRPHVTLKLAVSADGMIGTRGGERMIITGTEAFDAVQAMRTDFDLVMVGIGTVLVDNPRLTVRLPGMASRTPARVILDATARLPLESNLVQTAQGSAAHRRRRAAGAGGPQGGTGSGRREDHPVDAAAGGIDLRQALAGTGRAKASRACSPRAGRRSPRRWSPPT